MGGCESKLHAFHNLVTDEHSFKLQNKSSPFPFGEETMRGPESVRTRRQTKVHCLSQSLPEIERALTCTCPSIRHVIMKLDFKSGTVRNDDNSMFVYIIIHDIALVFETKRIKPQYYLNNSL